MATCAHLIDPLTGKQTPADEVGNGWAVLFPKDRLDRVTYTKADGTAMTGAAALTQIRADNDPAAPCSNAALPQGSRERNAQANVCNMAIALVEETGYNPRLKRPLDQEANAKGVAWQAAMADPVCKKISQDASPLSINFGTLGFCKNYRGFHDPGMPGIDRVVQTGPNGEVQTVSVFQGDTSCGGTLPPELNNIPK